MLLPWYHHLMRLRHSIGMLLLLHAPQIKILEMLLASAEGMIAEAGPNSQDSVTKWVHGCCTQHVLPYLTHCIGLLLGCIRDTEQGCLSGLVCGWGTSSKCRTDKGCLGEWECLASTKSQCESVSSACARFCSPWWETGHPISHCQARLFDCLSGPIRACCLTMTRPTNSMTFPPASAQRAI